MRRRRVRPTRTSEAKPVSSSRSRTGSTRRKLVSAATMLPLAIGLANTRVTPMAPPSGRAAIRPACILPFSTVEQHHPIDDSCGPDGNAPANSPRSLQNNAKNNFCAAGPAANLTFQDFHDLQSLAAARVTFGSDSKLPADRALLRAFPSSAGTVGEGSLVRLAAFVWEGHYSNLGKGESVNCNRGDKASNDIHIVLQERTADRNPCTSVTAEMSPHFRPDLWEPDSLNQYGTKDNPSGVRLFRFTGQLFFDASHAPCSGGSGPNPKRSSIWEIHPVYQVEVCAEEHSACTVDSDTNWQTLSDFTSGETTETWLMAPRLGRQDRAAPLHHQSIAFIPEL